MATYMGQHWSDKYLAKVEICDLQESDHKCSICREPFLGIPPAKAPGPEDRLQQNLSYFKLCGDSTVANDETTLDPDSDNKEQTRNENHILNTSGEIDLDNTPEVPVRLSCGHIFGKTCIIRWLVPNLTCPLCRSTPQAASGRQAHSIEITGTLGYWRYERRSMLQRIRGRCIPSSAYSRITTARAINFFQRETSNDEIPSRLMRVIFNIIAENAIVLATANGHLKRYVEGWAAHPEVRRFSISAHPSGAEIAHMVSVMRRELRECAAEIDRVDWSR